MADLTDKKDTLPQSDTQVAQPSACPQITEQCSKGEKAFDWVVYKGLNYWVNLISSIAISDYFQHGKGQQHLNKWIDGVAKVAAAAEVASPTTIYKQSKVAVETATLLSGGWLLLVPLKLMEDNKRPIVHWLNKKFGVQQRGADGHQLAPEEIYIENEQPQQTWIKVIARRLLGCGIVLGAGSAINHWGANKGKMQDFSYTFKDTTYHEKVPLGGKERLSDFVVRKVNKGSNIVTGNRFNFGSNRHTMPQRWMHFAVLDSVFSGITAATMWLTRGAQKQELPTEVMPCTDSQTAIASVINDNEQGAEKRFSNDVKMRNLSHAQRVAYSQETLAGQAL